MAQGIRPNGRAIFAGAMSSSCRPRKRLTVSQWADAKRRLSSKASSEVGQWRTSRTPWAKEPMDCLSVSSLVQTVVLMFASQMAKTEIMLNWIGYVIDHHPGPMLSVQPTLIVQKRYVRQRIDPMINETPELRDKLDARKTRDASNSEDLKDFTGGMLILGGANSPASLASMPVRDAACDEIDRFPWEVGKGEKSEGEPLELIRQRQSNFPRRKLLLASTPTIKDASRIEGEFEASDKRYYNLPCPECGELLVLKWPQLQWSLHPETKEPTKVWYACEHNGCVIEEHHKPQMLERGRWIPTKPESPVRGYHINALYAQIGLGFRWIELVRQWVAAQGDNTKLQVFINTKLAECYQDRTHEVKGHVLAERAESYALREIPHGCLILTAGVDVQGDRFEIQILGWGFGGKCWVIDYHVLPDVDPSRLEAWAKLAEYLNKPLTNRFGRTMMIECTAIDTGGHWTHDVYNFTRSRMIRRPMAIKGSNTPGKPILAARPTAQDVNWRGKVIKAGVKLWTIGTDTAKHALYNRLLGDANVEGPQRQIVFSNQLPTEYYDGLTSETFAPASNRWVKRRGRRNEQLDTWVYAAAAAQHPELRIHAMRANDWAYFQKTLEPADVPVDGSPTPPPAAPIARRGGRRVLNKGVSRG